MGQTEKNFIIKKITQQKFENRQKTRNPAKNAKFAKIEKAKKCKKKSKTHLHPPPLDNSSVQVDPELLEHQRPLNCVPPNCVRCGAKMLNCAQYMKENLTSPLPEKIMPPCLEISLTPAPH